PTRLRPKPHCDRPRQPRLFSTAFISSLVMATDHQPSSLRMSTHVQETIVAVIQDILTRKGLQPTSITRDTPIDRSLGLRSIDWAEVVVRLEDEFGTDPFENGQAGALRTLDDLVRLYEGA